MKANKVNLNQKIHKLNVNNFIIYFKIKIIRKIKFNQKKQYFNNFLIKFNLIA